jgi:hypothetical protein
MPPSSCTTTSAICWGKLVEEAEDADEADEAEESVAAEVFSPLELLQP